MRIQIAKTNYKIAILSPLVLGLILGTSQMPYWFIDFLYQNYLNKHLFINVITKIILTVSLSFLFTWVLFKINRYMNGTADFKITYALVSLSLIPIIVGLFFIRLLNIFTLLLVNGTIEYTGNNIKTLTFLLSVFPYSHHVLILFLIWSFYFLVTSNVKHNGFSLKKSLFASFLLVVPFVFLWYF